MNNALLITVTFQHTQHYLYVQFKPQNSQGSQHKKKEYYLSWQLETNDAFLFKLNKFFYTFINKFIKLNN